MDTSGFDTFQPQNLLACSLDAWANFCRTCTKLRRFSWLIAPLDDRYLRVFAQSTKPQLVKMLVAAGDRVYGTLGLLALGSQPASTAPQPLLWRCWQRVQHSSGSLSTSRRS